MTKAQEISDRLSRTVKLAVDSGEVKSVEEARELFEGYRLRVVVGNDVKGSATHQAALLTAINAGRRCFLGGVEVVGCPDVDLVISWKGFTRLRDAVGDLLGRHIDGPVGPGPPVIFIGGRNGTAAPGDFAVRVTFDGWIGGVVPADDDRRLGEMRQFTPAGVMAGALAVSEAFQFVRGTNPFAGRRCVGLSLWQPDLSDKWLDLDDTGPDVRILPANLWMIGLGHLGQAFLWTLGLLPYEHPGEVSLVLQDTDTLVEANESTSPLTEASVVGHKKTRAMAEWCERRGFSTRIVERHFANDFSVAGEEPKVAICGVDNAQARGCLESVGFDHIVEAGLGKGTEEFLGYQIHTFPGRKAAAAIWDPAAAESAEEAVPVTREAYMKLADQGLDKCGLTLLGRRSVGASFVGLFVSTFIIAEVIRTLYGAATFDVIDGTLRDPGSIAAIPKTIERRPLNLGFSRARSSSMA